MGRFDNIKAESTQPLQQRIGRFDYINANSVSLYPQPSTGRFDNIGAQSAQALPSWWTTSSVRKGLVSADNFLGETWKEMGKAWNTFTYLENRPSQAIVTGLGKLTGVAEAQGLDPLKVFIGKQKTDFGGKDIAHKALSDLADFFGTPKEDLNRWYYKVPEFVAGAAIDIATDPFMYIGLGEANRVGTIMKEGKRLGSLTDLGVKELKRVVGDDLTKVDATELKRVKDVIADRFVAGEKNLIDQGGLKFAGKTIVQPETVRATALKIQDSRTYNFLADSKAANYTKNLFREMFNPKYVGGNIRREVPDEFFEEYHSLLTNNRLVKQDAVDKAIEFLGRDLTPEEQGKFFDMANEGLTTKKGLVSAKELEGQTFEELKKMATDDVPDSVLEKYHSYINQWRPGINEEAKKLGLKGFLDDYIRNLYPELSDWKQKNLFRGRPIKDFKPGSFKGRLTDEEWYRGYLKSIGFKGKNLEVAVKDNKEIIPAMAKSLRESYGLSKDPYLSLAQERGEIDLKKNVRNFILDTLNKYGRKIKPEEAIKFKNAGYGIYYPISNLRFFPLEEGGVGVAKAAPYVFENAAIAQFLNKFSTDVTQNSFMRMLNNLSSRIVNVYFFHPQSVFYHAAHNLLYNTWLSGGIKAFDNITRGVEDIVKETPIYERAVRAGALRKKSAGEIGKTTKELLDLKLGRTNEREVGKILNYVNPLSYDHITNKIFWGSDSALRMNLFRNALARGADDKEAGEFVRHFAGNHQDLTDVEKSIFRLLYPYYAWFKTSIKAQFGTWLTLPERQLIPIKVQNALNEALSGRPLWENASGQAWKINTGQKDERGQDIYVNPAIPATIVPQIIQNPKQALSQRLLGGPVENLIAELTTGKDINEILNNYNPPESLRGAPTEEKILKSLQTFLPIEMQKAVREQKQSDLIGIATAWDRTHPMWRNILEVILGFQTQGVIPEERRNRFEILDIQRFRKAKAKQESKTK